MKVTKRRLLVCGAVLAAVLAAASAAVFGRWRVDFCVARLNNSDPAVRQAAITRLAGLRAEKDIHRLLGHLGDRNEGVRTGVIEALAGIGAPCIKPATGVAENGLPVRFPFLYFVNSFPRLIRIAPWLKPEEGSIPYGGSRFIVPARTARLFQELCVLFPRLGKPAVEPLIDLYRSKGYAAKLVAIRSLAQIGDPRAFDTLKAALSDGTWGIEGKAAEGLAALKSREEAARANPELSPTEAEAWRLYAARDAAAVEPLLGLLTNSSPEARLGAVRALGHYANDPQVFAALKKVQLDFSAPSGVETAGLLRSEALRGLARSANPDLPELVCLNLRDYQTHDIAREVMETLTREQQAAVLILAIGEGTAETRAPAIDWFYARHDGALVTTLVDGYRTADSHERYLIRETLARLAEPRPDGAGPDDAREAKNRVRKAAAAAEAAMREAQEPVK